MTSLAGQAWLTDPATQTVVRALEAAGGPGCARFVGGCVRDALIGQPVNDIDIATPLRPEAVIEAVVAGGLKAVPTGVAHGTVTAVSARRPFEITTLRRDVETDGRRAVVAFTDDWAEDAQRRDFRLNALYCDGEGQVFDPTGEGVADALAGRIVFVGDAETRIREDYLRILRFFRFYAWFGGGAPDAEGLRACAALAEGMARLSAERVSKELLKLLAASDPTRSVAAMQDAGVLKVILPGGASDGVRALAALAPLTPDPVLRLSALLPEEPAAVEAIARALRLSNTDRDRLVAAAGPRLPADLDGRGARAALYRTGRQAFADQLIRREARGDGEAAELRALAEAWAVPRLPVGGKEAGRLGVEGPDVGRLLKAFEADWIAADFPTSGHAERLSRLAERLPRG